MVGGHRRVGLAVPELDLQPDAVEAVLLELGQRHIDYGALPSYYHAVTSTLMATLKDVSGEAWTEEVDDAWHDGLESVVSVMIRVGNRAEFDAD